MGFILCSGNRLEDLADILAETLGEAGDPFESQTVLVQNQGMERWLRTRIAARAGICANVVFPFPNAFACEKIFKPLRKILFAEGSIAPGTGEPFTREALTWRTVRALSEQALASDPALAAPAAYSRGDRSEVRRYQLSKRIARLFDEYLVYRPDVLNAWARGEPGPAGFPESLWQAELWRRLEQEGGPVHFAALRERFLAIAGGTIRSPAEAAFAESLVRLKRVFLFGFSALAPAFLDIFLGLSRFVETRFYHLNPCQEDWSYNLSERERLSRKTLLAASEAGEAWPESFGDSNRLLGSYGKLGREFFTLLWSAELTEDVPCFRGPEPRDMLSAVQADIQLGLQRRAVPAEDDRSIQCHCCHGRAREIEVLRDHLLDWFEKDPDSRPADVIVMAPDISLYAPYIEATFDAVDAASNERIYFTVADRGVLDEFPEARAFLGILGLTKGRFAVSEVLDILEIPAVRERFGLSENDLESLKARLGDLRINWGLDAAFRERTVGVSFAENSWRAGLDRALLGYAVSAAAAPGKLPRLFETPDGRALSPFDAIEGGAAESVGKLAGFMERVSELAEAVCPGGVRVGLSPLEWERVFLMGIDRFFPAEQARSEGVQNIRNATRSLVCQWRDAGLDDPTADRPLTLDVVLAAVRDCLEANVSEHGFLRGGVTFCGLRPMRSVPAKIICLLGMNDSDYPRKEIRPRFDLIGRKRRFLDRSARDEDRYLFLETLLSARRIFYVSYVGRDAKDNAPLPPSPLVEELMDYLTECYGGNDPEAFRRRLLTVHPLQAFSRRYFDGRDPALFSYSRANLEAAAALAARRRLPPETSKHPAPAFASAWPSSPPESEPELSVDALARFLSAPARAFCAERLGVYPRIDQTVLPGDAEVISPDALDLYALASDCLDYLDLDAWRSGDKDAMTRAFYRYFQATDRLPPGGWGRAEFQAANEKIRGFLDMFAETVRRRLPPAEIRVPLDGPCPALKARFESLYETDEGPAIVFARPSSLKPKDMLRAWVYYLATGLPGVHLPRRVIVLSRQSGDARRTVLVPNERGEPSAMERLRQLVEIRAAGLERTLPFFPELSKTFIENLSEDAAFDPNDAACRKALDIARKSWDADNFTGAPKEKDDPYYRYCFGDVPPLDLEFMSLARTVYGGGMLARFGGEKRKARS